MNFDDKMAHALKKGAAVGAAAITLGLTVSGCGGSQPGFSSRGDVLTAYNQCRSANGNPTFASGENPTVLPISNPAVNRTVYCAIDVIQEGMGSAQATRITGKLIKFSGMSNSLVIGVSNQTVYVAAGTIDAVSKLEGLGDTTTYMQYTQPEILAIANAIPGNLNRTQTSNLIRALPSVVRVDIVATNHFTNSAISDIATADFNNWDVTYLYPNQVPGNDIPQIVQQLVRTAESDPALVKVVAMADVSMTNTGRGDIPEINVQLINIGRKNLALAKTDVEEIIRG